MTQTDQITSHICSNPQCKVAKTGRCLEGLTFERCPTYGRELEPEEALPELEGGEHSVNYVKLPSAATLELKNASRELGREDGRVIAILGPREAGKTSLTASLYDLFQNGPIGDVSFAGSKTMHAFELACHDSRAASRRAQPTQERTARGDVHFYHLSLKPADAIKNVSLFIGDRAGEEYRSAADDIAEAGPFPEVSRADTVTVLVDGARLLDDGARHNTRSETGMLLRTMADGGFFERFPHLVFVLTKLDLIESSENKDRANLDFERIIERAKPIVSNHTETIKSVQVAAAPSSAVLGRGTGMVELLKLWLRPTTRTETHDPSGPKSSRAILNICNPESEEGQEQ